VISSPDRVPNPVRAGDIGVAEVDELFTICDALKERINESQVT